MYGANQFAREAAISAAVSQRPIFSAPAGVG
jgi:hypothetical protein